MQILFGESVRRLRREKGLTQEQLAARLNVSFQTISKWERGESYPDITMLPVLAGFFGVRTDDLLGVDKAENEKHIQELLDYFHTNACLRIGQWEEHMAALKQALKDNPNDYRLWSQHFGLMTSLGPEDTAERCRARLPEVMPVYENILDNCTNDAIRIEVKANMLHFYNRIIWEDLEGSAAERALFDRIMGELPSLWDTRQYMGPFVSGGKSDEEMKTICQESITDLLRVFGGMATHLTNRIDDEREDIAVRRAMLDVFDAVYPDGDYGNNWGYVAGLLEFIAVKHAQEFEEYDEAFAALRRAAELAIAYDAQPQVITHTSPMLRGFAYEKGPSLANDGIASVRKVLSGEYEGLFDWPEAFKADPRFGALLSSVS